MKTTTSTPIPISKTPSIQQNKIKTQQISNLQKVTSYGIQIPTKQQLKEIKKKVQLLKQAILKQRSDRQNIQQQYKNIQQKYMMTQQTLQKKQQRNQLLLHQSRQLKDILIREKQQIKNIQGQIEMMKDKRKKNNNSNTNTMGNTNTNATTGDNKSWKNYLTSFWK